MIVLGLIILIEQDKFQQIWLRNNLVMDMMYLFIHVVLILLIIKLLVKCLQLKINLLCKDFDKKNKNLLNHLSY